jgi:prefoldin subunit 5
MTKKSQTEVPFSIPEETQERAKEIVQNAFHSLEEHMKSITEEIADFTKRHQEARRRMQNGARRTSGRIV